MASAICQTVSGKLPISRGPDFQIADSDFRINDADFADAPAISPTVSAIFQTPSGQSPL